MTRYELRTVNVKQTLQNLFRRFGFQVFRYPPGIPRDISPAVRRTIQLVRPYTSTTSERIDALCRGVECVIANNIRGAFVECGVWRGGSSMAVARTLKENGIHDREVYLFDTFEGMPPATEKDRTNNGVSLVGQHRTAGLVCLASEEEVRRNMGLVGYEGPVHFIKGMVEQTIPALAPDPIALLRLDTDWYASTKHELVHLFPRLSPGGILIIDDYGEYQGCRDAVDEYMRENQLRHYLHRIDTTGRLLIK
jgi:O-methyltransferase